MEPQEARKKVVDDIREVYEYAYGKFGFIKAEEARAHAVNGVMITIDKVWPFLAPKEQATAPASPAPPKDEKKPTASTPAPAQPTKPAKEQAPAAPAVPAKADNPAPETVAGEPAYDRVKLHWNRCPECGNEDIDGEYEKTNPKTGKTSTKKYQACFGNLEGLKQHNGIFLNFDGKTVPMKPREEEA
jgi:hypothetical protein